MQDVRAVNIFHSFTENVVSSNCNASWKVALWCSNKTADKRKNHIHIFYKKMWQRMLLTESLNNNSHQANWNPRFSKIQNVAEARRQLINLPSLEFSKPNLKSHLVLTLYQAYRSKSATPTNPRFRSISGTTFTLYTDRRRHLIRETGPIWMSGNSHYYCDGVPKIIPPCKKNETS